MKIGIVCPLDFSRIGGVQQHVKDLALNLKKRGHEVKIIASNKSNKYKNILSFGKSKLFYLNGTTTDLNIATGKEYQRLKNILKKEKFDILHYHHLINPFIGYEVLLNSKKKTVNSKNVITYHDTPPNTFFGKFLGKVFLPLFTYFINSTFMDGVITVSKSPYQYLKKLNKDVKIIPNGINTQKFNARPLKQFLDKKINILFLGRLEPRKGIFILLESYKKIKQKHSNTRLLIAGDGKLKEKIEDFIKENNLKDVEMMGAVNEHKKARLYSTCDIFVSPSIYGESFGIVLVEAMASKKPVIATANSGYKTVLKGEGSKLLTKPGSVSSLTLKLDWLISNPNLRKKFGEWGFRESKQYDWKKVVPQIEAVYREALKH